MPAQWRVIDDAGELEALAPRWDDLAVLRGRPFATPAWLLPWWRHARPRRSQLHVVAVESAGELIGISPWYAHRARDHGLVLRPLGGKTCDRVETLALPGNEAAVARATVEALVAQGRVAQVAFEGQDSGSPWPALLAQAWPGRHRAKVRLVRTAPAPVVHLAGTTFDEWFMSKTTHFRQRMRKARKEFDKQGGRFRLATADHFEHDLAAFVRVHRARWQARGGSQALTPGVEQILFEAGRELLPSGRFRLWSLEVGGEVVSSHILLRAAGEVGYWLTGWVASDRVGSTSLLGVLNSIEDAFSIGAERVQLGEGGFPYKYRFATGEDELRWTCLVPPGLGSRSAMAHLRLLGPRTRRLAGRRLPEPVKDRLRRL